MEEYKGYNINIFWDQECFSWLYDNAAGVEQPIAKSWESFELESECLEAAKKRINEFVLAAN